MTGRELDEHLKSGKRFVMFGDPVYYYPGDNKTEPYKWYREGMAQAEIAIESCAEEEFDSSWYNAEKLRHENDLLKQRVKELEEALRPFADEYVDYAKNLLNYHKANPQAPAQYYREAARTTGFLPTGAKAWGQ